MLDNTNMINNYKYSRAQNRMFRLPHSDRWRFVYKRGFEGQRISRTYARAVRQQEVPIDPTLFNAGFIFNNITGKFNLKRRLIDGRFKDKRLKKAWRGTHEIRDGVFYHSNIINGTSVTYLEDLDSVVLPAVKHRMENAFQLTLTSAVIGGVSKTFTFHSYGHFAHWIGHILDRTYRGGSAQSVRYKDKLRQVGCKDAFKVVHWSITFTGGCNKMRKSFTENKHVVGDYYEFDLFNPESRRNNCGLEVLRAMCDIDFDGKSNRLLRTEFKIETGAALTGDQLKYIYRKYCTTENPLCIISSDFDGTYNETYNYIFWRKGHYMLVTNVFRRGMSVGKIRELEYQLDQENDEDLRDKILKKIETIRKGPMWLKGLKRGLLAFDFETRATEEYVPIADRIGNVLKDTIVKCVYRECRKPNVILKRGFTTNEEKTSARQFLDWLKEEHREGRHYTCIAHNGANFDFYLLFKEFTENEILHNPPNFRNTSIIQMTYCGHVFKDSCCFMANTLDNLCKSFKISDENAKLTKFEFNGKSLTNIEMCFYKPNLTFAEFMNLEQTEPEFWKLYEKYCENDCTSLLELWDKFKTAYETAVKRMKYPMLLEKCTLNSTSTVAGLGMKLIRHINKQDSQGYRKQQEKFFDDECFELESHRKYNFVCNFKRGGISHCHQMGKHLHSVASFDITSQYPASMMKMKVPTGKSRWTTRWEPNAYGYYHVKNMRFNLPHGTKMFKPVCGVKKSKTESLNWATNTIDECYVDSEMLKYLIEHYELDPSFEVVEGLVSNKWIQGAFFFNQYINALFDGKAEQDEFKKNNPTMYNQALREVIKLFLNAVSGKLVEDPQKYFQVKYTHTKERGAKDLNGVAVKKDYGDFKPNFWVGCGVMMYSYSKRLLFEYIRMLPHDSDDIIHVETDGIYFDNRFTEQFVENIKNYRGKYPVAIGSNLGNVKPEHVSKGPSYWLGKKFYYLYCSVEEKEVIRIKGIPKETIDEHGTKKQLVDVKLYEEVFNGRAQTREFKSIRRDLWGKTQLVGFTQHRTANPRMRNYPTYE